MKKPKTKRCCEDYGIEPCFHFSAVVERAVMDKGKLEYLDLSCPHCGQGFFVKVIEVHKSWGGHSEKKKSK